MKQTFFLTILIMGVIFSLPVFVLANEEHSHKEEIQEGKELAEAKVSCDKLNDEQLEAIGEYFMEQMHPGESHETMHEMMGMEEGTEEHKNFHVNLAKMMYCGQGSMMNNGMTGGMMGMMPMMSGNMMGNWSNPFKENLSSNMMNNMMTNFGWFGWFGAIFMILFWVLVILGIVVLIKWLVEQGKGESRTKSALDILKERYAKGEISKEEFEEKKKDLS